MYTWYIFKKFQTEFVASNNYTHEIVNKDAYEGWYRVGLVEEDKRK